MARRRVQDDGAQGELAAANGGQAGYEPRLPSNAQEAGEMAAAEAEFEARKITIKQDFKEAHPDPLVAFRNELLKPTMAETVTVTWGEELFTPVQFCSFRVGPYSAMTTLRAGESREQAADRLMRELERIAAKERDTKIRVYREGLEKVIPGKARS